MDRGAPAGGFGVFRMIPRFFWNVDFQWTDSRRLFGGGFEDMEHEGCGGGLLGGVLLVRRVVAKASECVSPLRLDGASRMVGRRLACRDAPRLDPGLCNRFGQPAPPRIPGRGAAGRTETTAGAPGAETCTSHSRVQFQPLFSKAKRTSRGQNAHLDEEGAGRGCRGPRRRSRPGASPVRKTHCDSWG